MIGTKIIYQNGKYTMKTIRTEKHAQKLINELKQLDWQSWMEIKEKVDKYFFPENYKN